MRFDNPHYPVATSCPLWPVPEWSPICGSREDALTRRPYQTRPIPIPVTPVVLGPRDRLRRVMFVVQEPPVTKKTDIGVFVAAVGIVAGLWLLYALSQRDSEPSGETTTKRRKARRGDTTSGPWEDGEIREHVIPLSQVLKAEPAARAQGVSQVARSGRGFVRAYERAGGKLDRMGREGTTGQDWQRRRKGFIARHYKQMLDNDRPLWEPDGSPTRQHLALIMWAWTPDPAGFRRWLSAQG